MLKTEFVKNLHNNYERVLLEEKPQERRYQYCILSRGGIKGLLPCSLRYMNGDAYLYYDITSKQNVMQLCRKRKLSRIWVKDFFWNMQMIRMELERFLLDTANIIWYPAQIYQELENNIFAFIYMPYYEGDNGFGDLLEFLIEKIDYDDTGLVECVYKMYEQYENNGEVYLQGGIFEDVKLLEEWSTSNLKEEEVKPEAGAEMTKKAKAVESKAIEVKASDAEWKDALWENDAKEGQGAKEKEEHSSGRRGIFSFFENRKEQRKKSKATKESYTNELQISMEGVAVAEEMEYEGEDYGQTIYIEEPIVQREAVRRLYAEDGRVLAKLGEEPFTIGKKKEEVDLVLEDRSISRIHARITREGEDYFLEDTNSTNGSFKNGLRLQPYEKRKLQEEDEITLGAITLTFR